MLKAPIDFPHAGSIGYLRPSGQQLRIVQHLDDRLCLISIVADRRPHEASDNLRVPFARIAKTKDAACKPKPRKRTQRSKGKSRG